MSTTRGGGIDLSVEKDSYLVLLLVRVGREDRPWRREGRSYRKERKGKEVVPESCQLGTILLGSDLGCFREFLIGHTDLHPPLSPETFWSSSPGVRDPWCLSFCHVELCTPLDPDLVEPLRGYFRFSGQTHLPLPFLLHSLRPHPHVKQIRLLPPGPVLSGRPGRDSRTETVVRRVWVVSSDGSGGGRRGTHRLRLSVLFIEVLPGEKLPGETVRDGG